MDLESIALQLRCSDTPIRIAEVFVFADKDDYVGSADISSLGHNLLMKVQLDRGPIPMMGGGFSRKEFWKIGGLINGGPAFWSAGLPSSSSLQSGVGKVPTHTASFKLSRIFLLAEYRLAMSLKEQVFKAFADHEARSAIAADEASALLVDFEIAECDNFTETITENAFLGKACRSERDTLVGTYQGFEYALIQRGRNCEVHLRAKDDNNPSIGCAQGIFSTLLRVLGFAHGQHAWPQWQRLRQDGCAVHEFVTARRARSLSRFPVITEMLAVNGSSLKTFIDGALPIFLSESKFAQELQGHIFRAREAGFHETPFRLGLLGLCTAFEGLVGCLHEQIQIDSSECEREFAFVRKELSAEIERRIVQNPKREDILRRFAGMIASAEFHRVIDQFEALAKHFDLTWKGKMQLAAEAWKRQRNRLAHGSHGSDLNLEDLFDRSRIAGAINVLSACAIGYEGLIALSEVEDSFVNVKVK